MNNKRFVAHLKRLDACQDAVDWVEEHGGTAAECWHDCARGDWMNWLLVYDQKKFHITKRQLVGALAECARLSLKYYEAEYPDDKRVRECLDTCKRYSQGKATGKELDSSASATTTYATYDTATYATYAATSASAAAGSSATSAGYTAEYAAHAAYVAYVAYDYASRTKTLKQCANILRKHFPEVLG
jgi:hypothetical protein